MQTVFFVGLFFLILLLVRSITFFDSLPVYSDAQEISVVGKVDSVPQVGVRSQKFVAQSAQGVKLYVTTGSQVEYYYGQRIKLVGILKSVVLGSGKLEEETRTNDLSGGRVLLTLSFPKIYSYPREGVQGSIIDAFYLQSSKIRSHITGFYEHNLPQNSAAFLSGVVLGVDNGMTKTYRDSLISLGVVHVVAASGMNITIVAGVFFAIFSNFLSRRAAVIFSIVAIAFYTVIAGGQASIVRAAVMGIIAFSAGLLGRQYYGLVALFLTGAIMVFISPLYLVDVGFQLSFLSTLGLLVIPSYLGGFVSKLKKRLRFFYFIKEDLSLTISAQIATLPILFYYFGSYSVFSVFVNLLVLWVIPPIMILGGVSGVISFLIPELGRVVIMMALPFLYYFEWVIGVFSKIQVAVDVEMSAVFVIAYYFFLASLLLFRSTGKSKK